MSDSAASHLNLWSVGSADFGQGVSEDSDRMTAIVKTLFQAHADEIGEIFDRFFLTLVSRDVGRCLTCRLANGQKNAFSNDRIPWGPTRRVARMSCRYRKYRRDRR